jgi:hypothetical protein
MEWILKVLQHRNDGNGTIIEYQQDTSRVTQESSHKTTNLTFI